MYYYYSLSCDSSSECLTDIAYQLERANVTSPFDIVVLVCSVLTLLSIMGTFLVTWRSYKSLSRYYKLQTQYNIDILNDSRITSQNNVLAEFYKSFMNSSAIEGRRLLVHAYMTKERVSLSGNNSANIRSACEIYDLLGVFVLSNAVPMTTVSAALGYQAWVAWIGLNQKRRDGTESIIEEWRREMDTESGYLAHFEALVGEYRGKYEGRNHDN